MTTDLTKQGDMDLGIDLSDLMMIMMMIMMVSLLTTVVPAATQSTQALQAQAYSGQEDPRTIRATNILSWINLIYDYPFQPWVSAYFINDGPSAVEIGINYPDDRFTMNPRETITITRTGAEERIKIIYFIARPGLNASVRVTGVY